MASQDPLSALTHLADVAKTTSPFERSPGMARRPRGFRPCIVAGPGAIT